MPHLSTLKQDNTLLENYFPELSSNQEAKFSMLGELYAYWNAQINVISRKDMENFYVHHVLHSLAIAKLIRFKAGTEILDVGTGGGFPGIPLAIFFPDVKFHLVDATGKKIKVVQEVVAALGLSNVIAEHKRAEELDKQYDFIVSRAVTQWSELNKWTARFIRKKVKNDLPNGWLLLKGGDLTEEFKSAERRMEEYALKDYFKEEYFETKKLIYVSAFDTLVPRYSV
ncbi:MAG TPA: 16S rRNA (guanine(527)-N(7))-methyltransferase RsmG [Bacteroidia bacterium]|nr:16S rRNA (guanine(527)-N(7))-methyltransferase RsmG [Bacteroidia bacterium]